MEQYFITLQAFTLEEYEIWKQLNKYSDFNTNVAGYTVNQLVVNSDKRLNLTTQKVRTILKKFEKEGYIEFVSSGSKGKESTLKLMLKEKLFNNQQQCNNNLTNKSEQLQSVEQVEQQQSNNNLTILSKKKNKNKYIYSEVIDYLNIKANTNYKETTKNTQSLINARISEGYTVEDFKKVIDVKVENWLGTEWEKYLRPQTLFGSKFENYLNENKKAPVRAGTQNNNSVNPNICNSRRKYSQKCDIG